MADSINYGIHSTDPPAGGAIDYGAHSTTPPDPGPDPNKGFFSGLVDHLKPTLSKLQTNITDPHLPTGEFLKSWRDQSKALHDKASAALDRGDYVEAAAHWTNYMANIVPGVGQAMDDAVEKLRKADELYDTDPAAAHTLANNALGGLTGDITPVIAADALPAIARAAPGAARVVADAAAGGYRGGMAPTEIGLKIRGVPVSIGKLENVPASVSGAATGAAIGGAAGAPFGVGHYTAPAGAVVGGAMPIVKGAIKGVREGLAERAAAAAPVPPEVPPPLWADPVAPGAPEAATPPPVPVPESRRLEAGTTPIPMPAVADTSGPIPTDPATGYPLRPGQVPTPPPPAPAPPAATPPLWDAIARAMGEKDYASVLRQDAKNGNTRGADTIQKFAGETKPPTPPPHGGGGAPPPPAPAPDAPRTGEWWKTPEERAAASAPPNTTPAAAEPLPLQQAPAAQPPNTSGPPPAAPAASAPPVAAAPAPPVAAAPVESPHYAALRKSAGDRGADAAIAKDEVIANWMQARGMTGADVKPGPEFKALVDTIPNPNGKSGKFTTRLNDADHEARVQAVADLLDQKIAAKALADKTAAARAAAGVPDPGVAADARFNAKVDTPNGTPEPVQAVSSADGSQAQSGAPAPAPAQAESGNPAGGQSSMDSGGAGSREALPGAVQPVSTARSVTGAPTNVDLSAGGSHDAHYKVSELADVNPSHNGQTFQPNPDFKLKNDRNYQDQVNQAKIVNWATADPVTGFKPRHLINTAPDATSGPPVTDPEGNVLGGNGRTMTMQRVAGANPKGVADYRALLDQQAAQFGIDPASYAHMRQPFLHRELDASMEVAKKQDAVTDFNKSPTALLKPNERAIADSRRVSPETLDDMSRRMDAIGPDATLAQALEGKGGLQVLHNLADDGVIDRNTEFAALSTETGLTKAGKERVQGLLLGRFFENPEQMDAIPASIKNKIERLAAPAVRIEGGDFSLSDGIKKALSLIEHSQANGMTIDEHLEQTGLYADQKYAPRVVGLAKQLQTRGALDLTEALRAYSERARYASEYQGPGMFNEYPKPLSPADAYQESFGPDWKANDVARKAAAAAEKAAAAPSGPSSELWNKARPGGEPSILDRLAEGAKKLMLDKTGSVRLRPRSSAAAYDAAHQTSMFGDEPAEPAGDAAAAAALKDAMTKQLQHGGPPTGRTISGPLFDTQSEMGGLFGDDTTAAKYMKRFRGMFK